MKIKQVIDKIIIQEMKNVLTEESELNFNKLKHLIGVIQAGDNAQKFKSIPRAKQMIDSGKKAEQELIRIGFLDSKGNVISKQNDPILKKLVKYAEDNWG